MKTALRILFVCICVAAFAGIVRAKDPATMEYFPLHQGSRYTYQGKFNHDIDVMVLQVSEFKLSDGTVVSYFIDTKNLNDKYLFFAGTSFGMGTYFHAKDGLYTLDAWNGDDLPRLKRERKQLLIPADMTVGKSWELKSSNGDPKITVEIQPPENVQVPAGRFESCAKIHMHKIWSSGEVYDSYVWLAKDVGMVKWLRDTGRIDELTKVEK
jgi:hypothetical protein